MALRNTCVTDVKWNWSLSDPERRLQVGRECLVKRSR